ncbi:hypothetical protein BH20ACT6_BH20ACT6_22340 [soil metagenome]
MTMLLLLLAFIAFLAAAGRSATPARERIPVWHWSARDLLTNVVRGGRVITTPTPGRRDLQEAHLAELTRGRHGGDHPTTTSR